MSQRNKNNSIIFLTTLSVYLGLVLVGSATPQVWAQNASITFEERLKQDENFRRIVEECGKIKPRIHRKSYGKSIPLSLTIDEFINALIDLSEHSLCTAPEGFAFNGQAGYANFNSSISERQKPSSRGSWVSGVLHTHIETVGNSLPHTGKRDGIYFEIDFELDKTNLFSTAKFKQDSAEQAEQTAASYLSSLKEWRANKLNSVESAIYENSEISFENDQVIIVTRLPRGSLNELLKQDAKANGK